MLVLQTTKMNCIADEWFLSNAEKKRNVETYQMLQNLFKSIHIDNMKILKALIYAKDDMQPLVDGSTKRRVCSPNTLQHRHWTSWTIIYRLITETANTTMSDDSHSDHIYLEIKILM